MTRLLLAILSLILAGCPAGNAKEVHMNVTRHIPAGTVPPKEFDGGKIAITEIYREQVPELGLALATINGTYPPAGEGTWAINERVHETWYVVAGTAKVAFEDQEETFTVEPGSAVYFPRGVKYRTEDAKDLQVVIGTGPAWSEDQHKWSDK